MTTGELKVAAQDETLRWNVDHYPDELDVDELLALASARVSWHTIDDLVARGCDPSLAVRILA